MMDKYHDQTEQAKQVTFGQVTSLFKRAAALGDRGGQMGAVGVSWGTEHSNDTWLACVSWIHKPHSPNKVKKYKEITGRQQW